MPVWSTEGLPERAQSGFWREVICAAFAALDPRAAGSAAAFPSEVALSRIGPLNVARIASCAQVVRRGAREIRVDPQDRLFINLQLAGSGRIVQDGHSATLAAGRFALVDTARPYRLEFDGRFELISFRVPRQWLLPLVERPEALFAQAFGGGPGIGRIAAGFMQMLMEEADRLSAAEASALAAQLCQLVASAARPGLAAGATGGATAGAPRQRFVRAALDHLDAQLDDPALSVLTLAQRFGVSERYVQKAFAEAGSTVAATIRERRLARCAERLADPHDRRSVAAIAASWGFGDIPHFTRVFARTYGLSPGAWRRRCRADAATPPRLSR